jgi:hypothetical protein
MYKKLTSSILLAFFSLTFSSCAHTTLNREHDLKTFLPRTSFIHLEKTLKATSCNETQCLSMSYRSAASGYVVHLDSDGVFVTTAAHFCENRIPPRENLKLETAFQASTVNGKQGGAVLLHYERDIDVCLLFVKGMTEDVTALTIAEKGPQPGDKVYNVSAPASIFVPGMVPILEGRYNGEMNGSACYTLPAAPGSSGSMIVNENGELVGMVHSVYMNFHVITLSTNYEKLTEFINKYVHKFSLYKEVMDELNLEDIFTAKPSV